MLPLPNAFSVVPKPNGGFSRGLFKAWEGPIMLGVWDSLKGNVTLKKAQEPSTEGVVNRLHFR